MTIRSILPFRIRLSVTGASWNLSNSNSSSRCTFSERSRFSSQNVLTRRKELPRDCRNFVSNVWGKYPNTTLRIISTRYNWGSLNPDTTLRIVSSRYNFGSLKGRGATRGGTTYGGANAPQQRTTDILATDYSPIMRSAQDAICTMVV